MRTYVGRWTPDSDYYLKFGFSGLNLWILALEAFHKQYDVAVLRLPLNNEPFGNVRLERGRDFINISYAADDETSFRLAHWIAWAWETRGELNEEDLGYLESVAYARRKELRWNTNLHCQKK